MAKPAATEQPLADAFVALLTSVLNAAKPVRGDPEQALTVRAELLVKTWISSPDLGP